MIHRVLVAFDGSPASESALSIACSISGLTASELIGLFVEDSARFFQETFGMSLIQKLAGEMTTPTPLPPEQIAEVERVIEEESSGLALRFKDYCEKSRVVGRFLSIKGNPEEVIAECARSVDFVVIGSCGECSLNLGSEHSVTTINSLLRNTSRPVLVVPEEALGESRLVIAYDGSLAAERTLRAAAEFAETSELETVHLITISSSNESGAELQRPAVEYLKAYDIEVVPVILTGKPAEEIIKYAEKVDASVVALGAFGSNRIKEALFGSVTTEILSNSHGTAVLLVA